MLRKYTAIVRMAVFFVANMLIFNVDFDTMI